MLQLMLLPALHPLALNPVITAFRDSGECVQRVGGNP